MSEMSLDVGCGAFPRGNVNVDCDLETTFHHRSYSITREMARAMPNFVYADACHLPFRQQTFSHTTCFHTLEHVKHPVQLISELIRVTQGTIEIRTPHRYWRPQRESHLHYFSVRWFAMVLRPLVYRTRLSWQMYRNIPFFFIPCEITVEVNTAIKTSAVGTGVFEPNG